MVSAEHFFSLGILSDKAWPRECEESFKRASREENSKRTLRELLENPEKTLTLREL